MDCVFCKIVKGEIPADKVYEDESFLAFLDINPVNSGHTLVITKKHYKWVWDVPNAGEYFEVVRRVAKKIQKSMKTEFVASGIAGNDVPHAHIHLVPRYENDGHGGWIRPDNIKKIPREEMENIANKIRESF
jgi:histidine triad (HIT) family protein